MSRLVGPLFEELEARLAELPRKQQLLARTILEAPELVAFGSVRDLSSQLEMNNATVIRFAQSLGFAGYQALQSAVRDAYLARAGLMTNRRAATDDTASPVVETFGQQLSNLRLAQQHLSEVDLDQVTDELLAADRIIVCATGSAVVPALALIRLLRHVGLRGELVASAGVDLVIALHDVSPRDVVVVIGLWLTFHDALRALALARRQGAQTLAIVGSATSPLRRAADHTILAPAQGATLSFSVVATIAVVEALVAHLAGRSPERRHVIEQTLHDLYLEEGLLAPAFPPHITK